MKKRELNKKEDLGWNTELKELIDEYNEYNSVFRASYYHLLSHLETEIKRPKSPKEEELLRKQNLLKQLIY